ncbi:MAG: hypothetical protein JW827_07945 [Spirochaetes bacterium]|nr:hypothetical protein [Spirochaetota bacterium]
MLNKNRIFFILFFPFLFFQLSHPVYSSFGSEEDEKIIVDYVTKIMKVDLKPSEYSKKLPRIKCRKDTEGWKMYVDNKTYFIRGFCYSPVPIGFRYDWNIEKSPNRENIFAMDFSLMQTINANTVRLYNLWPVAWLEKIYKEYGIRFVISIGFGQYGVNVKGKWVPTPNYANNQHRKAIIKEMVEIILKYRNSPAVLLYVLGHENNYTFNWEVQELGAFVRSKKHFAFAKAFYSLANIGAKIAHRLDPNHPVALGNGDLQYIDIINKECPQIDIIAPNVYRGKSFNSFFEDVKVKMDKPLYIKELGCDAMNSLTEEEDNSSQAEYIQNQWQEIYTNSGKRGTANCIGGTHFEFLDEWWKSDEYNRPTWDVHDITASWPSEGYIFDSEAGNNMSEEWFGVVRQEPNVVNGVNERAPRPAFYILKEIWKKVPY